MKSRNYDDETTDHVDRKYIYNFDKDVMHRFMMESFEPFVVEGSALELGCYEGEFSARLSNRFNDLTCVDASGDALSRAKSHLGEQIKFIHSTFEEVELSRQYDNIFLTHVLEHLDDPVAVLERINDEWLSAQGRLFLVCPNANAPSRQIAVKMGLIDHNSAVTDGEAAHGHRCTYSFDTLEAVARQAGLKVEQRQGVFFKALANFQFDQLLGTDIISAEYLEGCYQLGQQYPELCASIFLLCKKSC